MARAKASEAQPKLCVSFQQGDLRKLDLGARFEVALMMFTVLGYKIEEADFTAALVFRFPGVMASRPSRR